MTSGSRWHRDLWRSLVRKVSDWNDKRTEEKERTKQHSVNQAVFEDYMDGRPWAKCDDCSGVIDMTAGENAHALITNGHITRLLCDTCDAYDEKTGWNAEHWTGRSEG